MRQLIELPATKLLSITEPESLFSRISSEAKAEYRLLAKRWHPDLDKTDIGCRVFAHITKLYRSATSKIANGSWVEPCQKVEEEVLGVKKFLCNNGDVKRIEYLAAHPFELGTMWVGDHTVAFEITKDFEDFFRQGRSQIRHLRFRDEPMALEMSKFLPQIVESFKSGDSNVLIVRKTPDQLLLADVLKFYKGRLEQPEHAGWILNVLLNVACYLEWLGTTHNAIALETVFISPLRHSGMLLGGWWYSKAAGERLTALPDRSLQHVPPDVLRNKRADARVDLELIKTVGRELFADPAGAGLIFDKTIPQSMAEWLRLPSSGKASSDYATWKYNVLPEAFGAPRFVNWKLESKDIYKEV